VLAGSAAYAVAEAGGWPVGLARQPKDAVVFCATLALAAGIGIGINFTPVSPLSALYWSAVINGVVAVPIMVLLMRMTARSRVMGEFTIGPVLKTLGWAAPVAMLGSVAGMVVTAVL
jgi:Mn2+/Fe2+ NRAMP family transporter